jgi:hypothetical protein
MGLTTGCDANSESWVLRCLAFVRHRDGVPWCRGGRNRGLNAGADAGAPPPPPVVRSTEPVWR